MISSCHATHRWSSSSGTLYPTPSPTGAAYRRTGTYAVCSSCGLTTINVLPPGFEADSAVAGAPSSNVQSDVCESHHVDGRRGPARPVARSVGRPAGGHRLLKYRPAASQAVAAVSIEHTAPVPLLYQHHGRAMLAYATRLANDRAAAENAVQDALVRACRRPELLLGDTTTTRCQTAPADLRPCRGCAATIWCSRYGEPERSLFGAAQCWNFSSRPR